MNNFMYAYYCAPPNPSSSPHTHTHTQPSPPPFLPIPFTCTTHKWDSCYLCFAFVCSIFANITPNVLYMCSMLNAVLIKQISASEIQSKHVSACKHKIQFPPPMNTHQKKK